MSQKTGPVAADCSALLVVTLMLIIGCVSTLERAVESEDYDAIYEELRDFVKEKLLREVADKNLIPPYKD